MDSKIVGLIKLNDSLLTPNIKQIVNLNFNNAYQEFAFGDWKTCVILNKTGNKDDGLIEQYDGCGVLTEHGQQLPYISYLINSKFNTEHLKFARIFSVSNYGLIIPHRDYLELNSKFWRIHIPLQTDLSCYISESDEVFHMQKGEIWYLAASNIHSAACFSNINRLHLVLDFSGSILLSEIFKSSDSYCEQSKPKLFERKPLSQSYLDKLLTLSDIADEYNFKDIIAILAKVHFFYKTHAGSLFDWLTDIAKNSRNSALIKKVELMKKGCIIHRDTGHMYN